MPRDRDFPQVEVASRAAWRAWLEANHGQVTSIWLITWKAGDPRYLPYGAVVEEALCFGWVDSLPRRLDAARTMLLLSPRRPGSAWSAANKARAEAMIAAGLMAPAGMARIAEAKARGLWTKLDAVEAMVVPEDLAAALAARPPARAHWDAFPRSARRGILEWITQAKTDPTRRKRVLATAEAAALNQRANQWRG